MPVLPNIYDPRRSFTMRPPPKGLPEAAREFLSEEGTVSREALHRRPVPLSRREEIGRALYEMAGGLVGFAANQAKDVALMSPAGALAFPRESIKTYKRVADEAFFGPLERLGASARMKFGGEWVPESERFGALDALALATTATGAAPGKVGGAAKAALGKGVARVFSQVHPYGYSITDKLKALSEHPLASALAVIRDEPLYTPGGPDDMARDYLFRSAYHLKPRFGSENIFNKTGPRSVEFNISDPTGFELANEIAETARYYAGGIRNLPMELKERSKRWAMRLNPNISPKELSRFDFVRYGDNVLRNQLAAQGYRYFPDISGLPASSGMRNMPYWTREAPGTHSVLGDYSLRYAVPESDMLKAFDWSQMPKWRKLDYGPEPSVASYHDRWDFKHNPGEYATLGQDTRQVVGGMKRYIDDILTGKIKTRRQRIAQGLQDRFGPSYTPPEQLVDQLLKSGYGISSGRILDDIGVGYARKFMDWLGDPLTVEGNLNLSELRRAGKTFRKASRQ